MHERRYEYGKKNVVVINKTIAAVISEVDIPGPEITHKPRMGEYQMVNDHALPASKASSIVIDIKRHSIVHPESVVNSLKD